MTTIQFGNGRAEVHAAHAHVFTASVAPVVTYRTAESRWVPFSAEYGADHRQVTAISPEDAAARVGAPAEFVAQVEAAARAATLDATLANESRWQAGRQAWMSMSQEGRDLMNDYALRTEGHTID